MINIRKVFICFLLVIALRGSSLFAETANIHSEIKASDLVQLVGLPFAWEEKQAFRIHNTNSKGEAVGTADFKNSNSKRGNAEDVAWYWCPEGGFQIIATENELLNAYGKDGKKVPFQFYEFVINESGVVAGSFLTDQGEKFNQCSWLWWSLERGIHLSALPDPDCYQVVKDIDSLGRVLLSRPDGYAIADISSMDDLEVFDFPVSEFNVMIKNWLINYCCNHYIEGLNKLLSVKSSQFLTVTYYFPRPYQPAINVQSWAKNGGIQGTGGGHGRLIHRNMGHISGTWPKGGILINFTFTIDSQGLKMAIKRV